ncbi:hypothetical protein [Faecalibacillus intestinalis]|uniref:hypothetical protein n=1 Tax=Faecalibacillus intestinalis TaxID=1982626 RepID=UPI00399170C4
MHFVINVFVTAVCFISIILFKEILNKIVKVLLSVIGCGTLSYALAILLKNVENGLDVGLDAQYIKSDFLWIFAIVLVVYIIINIIKKKIKLNFSFIFLYPLL